MPIDPSDLAQSIGSLGPLDPRRGLAPTLQQVTDAAKQLFEADGAGLMLVDADGALRWASASDQAAQTLEDGQERLAQGPCAVSFSQRLPAAIHDIRNEPDWQEFAQVLVSDFPQRLVVPAVRGRHHVELFRVRGVRRGRGCVGADRLRGRGRDLGGELGGNRIRRARRRGG